MSIVLPFHGYGSTIDTKTARQKGMTALSAQPQNGARGKTDDVRWEYRLADDDSAPIEGPYSTEDMIRFQESGDKFPKKGCYCRRAGTSSHWYNSNRVDFELYLD